VIRFNGVSKEYPRSGAALRDVSLHIHKGELVFLTGHSGAGKSTVLRLVQMAEFPSAGEVRVSGFSSRLVKRRDIPMLRRKLGVVFQDFRLLRDRTAEENVAFALEVTGAKNATIAPRVHRVLTQVGLAHKSRAYPDELSGVNEPLLLLADEPTGNLDEWAAKGIFELFREINAMGMTVVMATHDLDLVRGHPEYRVIELAHGSVVYDSASAVLAREGA
jgi:cell division transport system ATP-binding protein